MANEKRLIDVDAEIRKMRDALAKNKRNMRHLVYWVFDTVISILEKAPTVDAVVLPCEIGREVFYIWSVTDDNGVENFTISIGKVVSFSIQGDGVWASCRYEDGFTLWYKVLDDFGRVLFLTREEAETALAKMDGGNGDGK